MSNKLAWLQCVALLSATAALAQPAPSRDGLDPAWNGGVPLGMPVAGYNVDASIGGNVGTVVQPDGHILLAGPCMYPSSSTTSNATICMARVLPDGQREYGFGPGQIGAFGFAQFPSWPDYSLQFGLARQGDGRIVVAGASIVGDTPYALIARLDADGTLDSGLPTQPVNFEFAHNDDNPQSAAIAVAQQADGKFLVAGRTIRVGNNPNADFAVARLRADFSLDPTFNGSGVSVVAFDLGGDGYDFAQALAIQGDGKIVVAGYADTTSSGTDAAVLRLNANGTLDTSFGNAGRATFDFGGHHRDDVVNDVKIDGAGRIWLAGSYQQAGTNTDFLVARLRADGALDTAFNNVGYQTVAFDLDAGVVQQLTDKARSLLLQPDGKIVLAARRLMASPPVPPTSPSRACGPTARSIRSSGQTAAASCMAASRPRCTSTTPTTSSSAAAASCWPGLPPITTRAAARPRTASSASP